MKKPIIVIPCGGRGKRMGKLTEVTQKCLLPLNGKPILSYILDTIQLIWGEATVILCTGYRREQLLQVYGSSYKNLELVHYCDPTMIGDRKTWEMIGQVVKEDFFIHDGDVICDPIEIKKLLQSKATGVAHFLASTDTTVARTHPRVTINNDMQVIHVADGNSNSAENTTYSLMDCGTVSIDYLQFIKDLPEEVATMPQVLTALMNENKHISIQPYTKKWYHFAEPHELTVAPLFPQF